MSHLFYFMSEKKIVCTVSGGKDSQAAMKLACETHDPESVLGIFVDTGWEHPLTVQHVAKIGDLYKVKIVTIRREGLDGIPETVESLSYRYPYWPSMKARYCTGRLKMKPMNKFLIQYCRSVAPHPVEQWCGLRRAEGPARRKRFKHTLNDELHTPSDVAEQYRPALDKTGCMIRLPIVDWSDQEVMSYLEGQENPLYRAGFRRVGCFPCLAAGDVSKIQAFSFDDFGREQYAKVQAIEEHRKNINAKERNCCIMQTKYGKAWASGDTTAAERWIKKQVAKADAMYGAGCSFCSM